MNGKLITFEGVDGAGKSTHVEWFANALRSTGRAVVVTREPGGSGLAEKLRELVLHESMDAVTETLLVFAARNDHLKKRILPAIAAGTWVVCDRFTDATVAYQGGGKGVDRGLIDALRQAVHPGLQPDLTLIFDCAYGVSRERMARSGRALDRFEREGQPFFERVRMAYLGLAQAEPERIHIIDSTRALEVIRAELRERIAGL
ncbi:MAG: dTMP kinase [Betaproteobacteria bacterium]|nr:dTMP kinase [Betaproteobacteria bacterium]